MFCCFSELSKPRHLDLWVIAHLYGEVFLKSSPQQESRSECSRQRKLWGLSFCVFVASVCFFPLLHLQFIPPFAPAPRLVHVYVHEKGRLTNSTVGCDSPPLGVVAEQLKLSLGGLPRRVLLPYTCDTYQDTTHNWTEDFQLTLDTPVSHQQFIETGW